MIGPLTITSVLLLTVIVAPAAAQNTEDYNAFDFSLPGARSRGMGGAFVALADDATAAYSNPAGLTLLFRPEISIEGALWNLETTSIDHGHSYGPATNIGIDTVNGLVNRTFSSWVGGVSFLSFAYPQKRWSIGVFRHQLARYRMNRQIQGAFFNCQGGYRGDTPSPPYCEPHAMVDGIDRIFPAIQSYDLDIHSTGAAAAYSVTERLSIGLAVQYFRFRVSGSNVVYASRGDLKYLPAQFGNPANIELVSSQGGEDSAWGANAGVIWDVAEHWVAGASFRQGPKFRLAAQSTTGPANLQGPGVIAVNVADDPFKVPDTFASGLTFRPSNAWRVSVEYDLVRFSQLASELKNTSSPPNNPEGTLLTERLHADSANQLRLGGEYLANVLGDKVAALRGGIWYDPQHQLYFQADNSATGYPAPRWTLYFPQRDGNVHLSAGLGFSTRHFQVDAAADFSSAVNTFSVSTLWRF
jgi:long-subunit fatty acid transport protein